MWAGTYNCAVVLIGHLNKNAGSKNIYRGSGSIDFVASARSVLHVERSEESRNLRVVHQIKNSLAPRGRDVWFEITEEGKFHWTDNNTEVSKTSKQWEELPKNKHELAAVIMRQALAKGDVESKEMAEVFRKYSIGSKTIQETKTDLGVTSYRRMQKWYWHLE